MRVVNTQVPWEGACMGNQGGVGVELPVEGEGTSNSHSYLQPPRHPSLTASPMLQPALQRVSPDPTLLVRVTQLTRFPWLQRVTWPLQTRPLGLPAPAQ